MKILECGAQPVEGVAQLNGEFGTGLGEKKPAWFANEKRRAQAFFQKADLIADRGLCDRKLFRGARKIHMPCRGLKGTQARDGRQMSYHKADLSWNWEAGESAGPTGRHDFDLTRGASMNVRIC